MRKMRKRPEAPGEAGEEGLKGKLIRMDWRGVDVTVGIIPTRFMLSYTELEFI
jgi:hypothetical protein